MTEIFLVIWRVCHLRIPLNSAYIPAQTRKSEAGVTEVFTFAVLLCQQKTEGGRTLEGALSTLTESDQRKVLIQR